eukprot:3640310-Rhodomonas_salina.1
MIDDPLRALRAVRFATRYSFSLEDDLRKVSPYAMRGTGLATHSPISLRPATPCPVLLRYVRYLS